MLDILRVQKTFNPGTVNEKKALQDLNLHLDKGDFVTIIGSNGAGKSTLFNMISGTILPDAGAIRLGDADITWLREHKRSKMIGRLFQDPHMGTAPHMSIEENLALAYLRASKENRRGHIFSRISRADRAFFKDKLAELGLGLENRIKSPVGLLSGGQRQALTLLMATLVTPKLLLLDEHTASLDPVTADKVLSVTRKIVKEHAITCLMITHNISSALELGNRTIMMDGGRIVLSLNQSQREGMTVAQLLDEFACHAHKALDNDRMLLK